MLRRHPLGARALAQLAAGVAHGGAQRGDEPARVDGVVAGDVEREPHGRRERRLGAARGGRQQPLDLEAEPAAEGEQPVERLGLVAVAGDDQRAGAVQARVLAGGLGELGGEGGEPGGGAQAELQQRVLAEARLGDGREHPGGDAPGAGLAGVEHGDAQAGLRGAPRGRQPDRAAADDGDVRLGLSHHHDCCAPSLRRHDPDQVRRSAPRWRPLSPAAGSRMWCEA